MPVYALGHVQLQLSLYYFHSSPCSFKASWNAKCDHITLFGILPVRLLSLYHFAVHLARIIKASQRKAKTRTCWLRIRCVWSHYWRHHVVSSPYVHVHVCTYTCTCAIIKWIVIYVLYHMYSHVHKCFYMPHVCRYIFFYWSRLGMRQLRTRFLRHWHCVQHAT